ncbi:MAG: hypothetical protein R6W73_00575 [Candidatus Saliniplasma sp.]
MRKDKKRKYIALLSLAISFLIFGIVKTHISPPLIPYFTLGIYKVFENYEHLSTNGFFLSLWIIYVIIVPVSSLIMLLNRYDNRIKKYAIFFGISIIISLFSLGGVILYHSAEGHLILPILGMGITFILIGNVKNDFFGNEISAIQFVISFIPFILLVLSPTSLILILCFFLLLLFILLESFGDDTDHM